MLKIQHQMLLHTPLDSTPHHTTPHHSIYSQSNKNQSNHFSLFPHSSHFSLSSVISPTFNSSVKNSPSSSSSSSSSMAAVLESVTIPRSSPFQSTRSPPSMASSLSITGKFRSLPEFSGLKAQFCSQKSSSRSRNERIARRNGSIVCEAPETAVEVPSVTDKTWESLVIKASLPVLVEFWAPWCGPCRLLLPVIGELSKQYAGKLDCYKLNTDESPSIATEYGIRSIPTVMIFRNGEKKDAIIGAVPKTTLTTSIEKFL